MVDLIVWSRERAAQLDLLLRSIQRFAPNIFNISVIYNGSAFRSYEKVREKHQNVYWIPEIPNGFAGHTKFVIKESKNEHVAFTTDDTVLYRAVNAMVLEKTLPKWQNEVFSLRLGFNTIEQDIHSGTVQPPLNVYVDYEDWIEWPIDLYHPLHNYGYPFGLDMHIYRRDLILELLNEFEWNNTSQLESGLTMNFRSRISTMKAFKHSVAVNIPVNTAGGVTRAGEINPLSTSELEEKFLDGYIIDLDSLVKQEVRGCHQELKLELVKE